MNNKVRFLTRTAMLLALTIVLQYLGRFIPAGINSNFVVGPLVNACLIIATGIVGIWSGIIIAFASALFAAVTSPLGAIFLLPTGYWVFIGIGNAVLVILFGIFNRKDKTLNQYTGLGIGAIAKFIVIFGSLKLYLDVFLIKGNAKPPHIEKMLFAFGWPQLLTAVIGGVIAIFIINRIKNKID